MDEILAALVQLDPDNNDHWTSDGSPRMDAVQTLLGRAATRAEITTAAPQFKRENPVLPGGSKVAEQPTEAAPNAVDPEQENTDGEVQPDGEEEAQAEEPLSAELLELSEAEAAYEAATQAKVEAERALAAAQVKRDAALVAAEMANADPHANTRAIQDYLETQGQLRAERAERAQALRGSGLTASLFNAKSAIDNAMARRRSLGQQRPTRG